MNCRARIEWEVDLTKLPVRPDRVDCGVDTTIEVECPECREAQDVDLPFDSAFFLPGKERTARRKARSASSPT